MNLLQDIRGGWRARPLASFAGASLALGLSLLISTGLWLLQKAKTEADILLKSWPADQCTLLIRRTLSPEQSQNLEQRLPPNHWYSFEIEGSTAWISGTLPPDFFHGRGRSLSPEVIARGEPAVLLQQSPARSLQPGDLFLQNEQAFRIYGIGRYSLPVDSIIPRRAKDLLPPAPQEFKINLPASLIKPLVNDLLQKEGVQLVDHQDKQRQARAGFRKLRRNLSGIALASALLAALLLQALHQSEIRERKSEFALRRSLGARPEDIRNQILLETFTGSAIPSLVGTLLFLPAVPFTHLAMAWCAILGWILLCASLPALQAAHLHPSDALKGE
ncbi:ABC transporter permease [Kiritimatiellaeota bacterium B1221]|nr:ABC transporter permease [Kiritimatiellaeota bacterium B1221]